MTLLHSSSPAFANASTNPTEFSEGWQVPVSSEQLSSTSHHFPEISQLVIASGYRIRATILLATVLATISGAAALWLVPAQYIATATVRVLQREGYLLSTQQSRAEDAAFVRAQEALVSQEQTLQLALHDNGLGALTQREKAEDQVVWLRNQIKAEIAVGSEAMTISASNSSADLAVLSSRAVTQAYIATVTEQLRSGRDRRIRELELTAKEVEDKLMQQWRLLQSKAGKIGSGNPQALMVSEQLKLQSYRENTQRLRSLQFQRSQIELQLNAEKSVKLPVQESPELQIQSAIGQHPEVIALREQVRQVDIKIQGMKELVQSNSAPQLVRLQNEREYYLKAQSQAEAKVDSIERTRQSKLVPDRGPSLKVKGFEDQLTLIDQEILSLRDTTTQLESSIVETSGPTGVELEIMRHEIEREEKLADNLWKTLQELRIEARAEPRVSIISLPSSTNRISRSKQLKAATAASLFGLIVAVLGVGFFEWSSRLVRSPNDVENRARLRVFGASALKSGIQGANEVAAQLLLNANLDGSVPSVFVTSSTSSESRGRLSVELAEAIAGSGRRVLHVACCSGKRTNGKSANADSRGGSQATDWNTRIRSSVEHGFDYLNIEDGEKYSKWIVSKSLPQFLNDVKQRYDSIIVLGPAVLNNAEAVLLASKVDFTILTVDMGRTRLDLLVSARNRLQLPNSKILGAVFNIPRHHWSENSDFIRNSESDCLAEVHTCAKYEEDVLAEVKDLQGQITQFDVASSTIAAPHTLSPSRITQPSLNKRTPE